MAGNHLKLQFLGATGTVTGSRYLLSCDGTHVLIDCGLFQGVKNVRQRNWSPLPFPAGRIDAVVLTHAHLDHSGYLPRLLREGFQGPVYCTSATQALADILLPDSGALQEEDARRANRYGYTKHAPAQPLYTVEEASRALGRFKSIAFREPFRVGPLRFHFTPAGHILGAASVRVEACGRNLVFSGDLGRPHDLLMLPPAPPEPADYLVVESTYGDRRHVDVDPREHLAELVNRTVARGGLIMVPTFAVGRAQYLLHLLAELRAAGTIPNIPIYLDSPMAIDVTELLSYYHTELRLNAQQCRALCAAAIYVRSAEESKKIGANRVPKIIIAGAGMLTGGRILHHLRQFGSDHRNTLLLTGFQAQGTRGHALLNGATTLKIFGEEVPIHCAVEQMSELSAHSDYVETGDWLAQLETAPRALFLTHGEPVAADRLRQYIETRFRWNAVVPEMGQEFVIS